MDRQLAERMVGAACLLAVMVLVVPAILDGNPDSGSTVTHPPVDDELDLRTHTIRLDGSGTEPPVPTPVPSAAAPEPPPRAEPESQPESEPQPGPEPEPAPVAVPAPLPVPAAAPPVAKAPAPPPPPAAAGDWIVQLGSFSSRADADRLAADVRRRGFNVAVESGGGSSGTLYRVRVGPEADRAGAEALAARLTAAGFKGGRVGRR